MNAPSLVYPSPPWPDWGPSPRTSGRCCCAGGPPSPPYSGSGSGAGCGGGTHLPPVAVCPQARDQGSRGLLPRPRVPLITSGPTSAWGQHQSHPPASHASARDSAAPSPSSSPNLGRSPACAAAGAAVRRTACPAVRSLGPWGSLSAQLALAWLHTQRHAPRGVGRGTGHSRPSQGTRAWWA